MSIAENVAHVQARIAAAAITSGRDPSEVTLVAVTKTFDKETVERAAAAGLRTFGENRVQEAAEKIPMLPESFEWHMIGHVQSNKAKHTVGLFDCVQSVDSARLAAALSRHAADLGRQLPVLLQMNVTGKESRFGFQPADLSTITQSVGALTNLRIEGLMTIASFTDDEATLRAEFRTLRELRARLQSMLPDHPCRELSMGMTNDFPIAIEEGATIVRVGRALFGERPVPVGQRPSVATLQST